MSRLLIPIRILLAIALAVVVWASLSQIHLPGPQNSDKVAHFIAYFGVAFLGLAGFRTPRNEILFIVFCFILGASMEYAQSFVPGRMMSWADMIANSLGIVGAVLVYLPLRSWIDKKLGRGEESVEEEQAGQSEDSVTESVSAVEKKL